MVVFMTNVKPILVTSLDGVICDYTGHIKLFNQYFNTNLTKEDFNSKQRLDEIIDGKVISLQLYFQSLCKQNPYQYCNLIDDAYNSLKELSKHFNIFICTGFRYLDEEYHYDSMLIESKLRFISNYLSFIDLNNVIFSNNKNLISGASVQIDTNTQNLINNSKNKILFETSANSHVSKADARKIGISKTENWNETLRQILS